MQLWICRAVEARNYSFHGLGGLVIINRGLRHGLMRVGEKAGIATKATLELWDANSSNNRTLASQLKRFMLTLVMQAYDISFGDRGTQRFNHRSGGDRFVV